MLRHTSRDSRQTVDVATRWEPASFRPDCNERGIMNMASSWTRLRYHYLGRGSLPRVLAAIILLILLYLVYHWISSPNRYGIVRPEHSDHDGDLMAEPEIKAYIRILQDTRPASCHGRSYSAATKGVASIILDYNEQQFYDLKLTLTSIMKHTPDFLYQEIVVLDDGTVSPAVRKHAQEFIRDPQYRKVKMYRSEDSHGPASSRFKAAALASADVLVFVSSSVVVNAGWLEPLLHAVVLNPRQLAVPHHDNLLSGHRFFPTDNLMGNVFGWTLTTVHMQLEANDKGELLSPVMRGDVFAVDKKFLHSIGSYDESMGPGGGHDLELSLRAWLCGGKITMQSCARVAVHSTYKPLQVTNEVNFRRIAELWLGDSMKQHAYRQSGIAYDMEDSEEISLRLRKDHLRKLVACDGFEWYLHKVAPQLQIPTDKAVYFGKLKVQTGYCVRQLSPQSDRIDMVTCRPHVYDPHLIFEMDSEGMLRQGQRCLQLDLKVMLVKLAPCDKTISSQHWLYKLAGQVTSHTAPNKCLQQISEIRADNKYEYYPMMINCAEHSTQVWSFIKY